MTESDLLYDSLPVKDLAKPCVKKEVIDILWKNGFQVCRREIMEQYEADSLELAKIKAQKYTENETKYSEQDSTDL